MRNKKTDLQLHIQSQSEKPDVIAIQEPRMSRLKLPGYRAVLPCHIKEQPLTTTLVHRNLTVVNHEIENVELDCILIEILPSRRNSSSLFVLNAYSHPRAPAGPAKAAILKTLQIAGQNPTLIVGDFNAQHVQWGHATISRKGTALMDFIQQRGLTQYTDPMQPTRIGNSVTRDTCPDLTIGKNLPDLSWSNTRQNLGSDHYIIMSKITIANLKPQPRKNKITDWDKLRTIRDQNNEPIIDLEHWTQTLLSDVGKATKELVHDLGVNTVDSRLTHMWEARQSLEKRWLKQKYNKKLRNRIVTLTKEIQHHTAELARQQWNHICENVNGNLGTRETWNLLRHLLDPESNKATTQKEITKILNIDPGTDQDIIDTLQQKYFCTTRETKSLPNYKGEPNSILDADITMAEIRAALFKVRTTSAPGEDGINNKTLRNLDDASITALADFANECWREGKLPASWKHAIVKFIPKPGKKLALENLRPISLTSCIGKLIEHVILDRLQSHMQKENLYPNTMVGFRPHLSTQDTMLRLANEVLSHEQERSTRQS